jgi:hypothetical protein
MYKPKSHTAYYKPIPLNFWFYFWLVLLIVLIIGNIIRLIWPSSNINNWENYITPIAYSFLFFSTGERLYKQYRNSKIKNCFVKVDDEGIRWNLHHGNYNVKESEIVVWSDIKKVVIDDKMITIKYMSTYFSDNIPFEKLSEDDKRLLIDALNDHIQYRSIPYENRMAA